MLAHGGEPLTIPERARLTLARALFATPALLVFDHLDADLGRDGRATIASSSATTRGWWCSPATTHGRS